MIPEWGRSPGEGIGYLLQFSWASLLAQLVRDPPATQPTLVRFLGWEDCLEKGKTTHCSVLAWRIPWTVWGHQESDRTERLSLPFQSQTPTPSLPNSWPCWQAQIYSIRIFFNAHFGVSDVPFRLLIVATSDLQIWALALFLLT